MLRQRIMLPMVPIHICVKAKNGDISLIDNYRPLSIATVLSKIIELIMLHKRCNNTLQSSDFQFGFKHNQSTAMCICALKEIMHVCHSC
jgi:hypothetical protein